MYNRFLNRKSDFETNIRLTKPKSLKEEEKFQDIVIYSYDEYIDNGYDLNDVVDFYNKMFPKSQHDLSFKENKYSQSNSIVLIAVDKEDDRVVGLLESWMSNGERLLSTVCVYEQYQGMGLLKRLHEMFIKQCKDNTIILHFRDSNKAKLEKVYNNLGYTNLQDVGSYMNGEIKWEMEYNK